MFKKMHFELIGKSPLLMHNDNFRWADQLKEWLKIPENKKKSIAGDDRTPAFTWLGYLYLDQGFVAMPSDNIMAMLREGGAKCPTGQGKKTFKAQTQSGIIPSKISFPLLVNGAEIPAAPFLALKDEEDYPTHHKTCEGYGFELFEKRARIGMAKHIRVRPRFNNWSVEGEIDITDEMLTAEVVEMIFRFAGRYCGLGDWRPSSAQPGQFGMFDAKVIEV